jgi:putative addiction module antidote
MPNVKIVKIGHSLGIELSEEILRALPAALGDSLTLAKVEGGFLLSASDPVLARQLAAGLRVMKKRDAVLRELAK